MYRCDICNDKPATCDDWCMDCVIELYMNDSAELQDALDCNSPPDNFLTAAKTAAARLA